MRLRTDQRQTRVFNAINTIDRVSGFRNAFQFIRKLIELIIELIELICLDLSSNQPQFGSVQLHMGSIKLIKVEPKDQH
ncbi:hypothetical protein KFK09_017906 [Dendrobium nobile]|uniref:Uncharacterized protein n=1 Tax=Dendrobium nobile TaxID=94219 RepID=A0A8T3AUD3_DENNO|nr:hypothetical protein KFK09_017906 [Dendrobium nobile]